MTEEEQDGELSLFGGGGRGRGRGNNGGGRGNREIDNSYGFPIVDEETHATTKDISPSILPNFYGLRRTLQHFCLSLESCAKLMTI